MYNLQLKKGILYIVFSCFFFSLMSVFVKLSSSNLTLIETVFLRSLSALIIIFPLVYFKNKNFRTKYFKFHFLRSLIGTLAMLCMFYALRELPLSNVIIISFSKIFFIIPLAFYILKEKVSFYSFSLICLGFCGVIIALGIDSYKENYYFYFFAFFGAFLIALVKIIVKKIAMKEDTLLIQFYFALLSSCMLFFPYLKFVSLPTTFDLILIFSSAVCGILAQYFTISGLKLADATKILPFDFFRIIFGVILGVIIFSEDLTYKMFFGSLLIFLSSMILIKKIK